MEKDAPHTQTAELHDEITVLLRSLRIEATPEAHFEERFVYDFRERLVREAACRPARALIWERLLLLLDSFGGKKLAWSLSSFGVGALCMGGVLLWQTSAPAKRALASQLYELGGGAAELRPGAVQEVVCTSVRHAKRKLPNRLIAARLSEPAYLAGVDEEADSASQYFSSALADDAAFDMLEPGLLPHMAH